MRIVSAPLLARMLLTALAGGQGFAPIFIDLNRTHATHPQWPGRARFHLVQQVVTLALTAVVEVGLIWWPGPSQATRFYLAAFLTATSLAGFLVAFFTRGLYRGTLRDPRGIPPGRIRTRNGVVEFDVNIILIGLAAALLSVAVMLF